MIEVEQLTKEYAGRAAVSGVSFKVGRGEIVGFLGPNGAGKSTTMRILACYLPATSGRARVAGFDVFEQSLEVRRRLGYLPENVPLHTELRVDEYLSYRAALRGLSGNRARARVAAAKEQCALEHVGRRIIGQLSKGYRQRVGLADALLHEPDLLILDEPTIGLDPEQIAQVRDLIRSLGERHTVLLSTHILPEVEAVCSRVIIIHRGRIAAQGTAAELTEQAHAATHVRVEAKLPPGSDGASDLLAALPGVEAVERTAGGAGEWRHFELRATAGMDPREEIFRLAAARGWTLREVSRRQPSLEEVFVRIIHSGEEAASA